MLFRISAWTGAGMPAFMAGLADFAARYFGSEPALITRERHRKALKTALFALNRAVNQGSPQSEDILAEELRLAATALGRLTGRVGVEDILDVIFRDFCIGK
jgi:tRNA modification GTPase